MKKRITIMQILPSLQSGGVERGTIDIAKAIQQEGLTPIVVSSGGVMTYSLREAKIEHVQLKVNTKNPLQIFYNIDEIVKLINKYKVDIVHVRSRAPMISAYFACKKTNTKLISTVHGNYSTNFLFIENFLPKIFYNAAMLRGCRVIAVSNFIKNYLLTKYNKVLKQTLVEKITVIPRGVDLNYFNPDKISLNRIIELARKWNLPEDKKIILLPARITSWKGHEFLLRALSKVKSDFYCIFAGSDHGHKNFRKKLEKKIISLDLASRVKFVGICKEMPLAYAVSNLVISASTRPEAFGRIAIEAQAMKKIVIATKIGGSLETIIDGKTGFLVDPQDCEKMTQTIEEVLSFDKSKIDNIGQNARSHVEENFSNKKMCDDTIKVYKSLLGVF